MKMKFRIDGMVLKKQVRVGFLLLLFFNLTMIGYSVFNILRTKISNIQLYKTLSQSKRLKEIALYVLYHHERWDGKGYPEGLSGDEIPIVSQIISIADSWDAMLSDRSYRKALSKEEAIQEIIKHSGSQFSPRVVDVFLALIN